MVRLGLHPARRRGVSVILGLHSMKRKSMGVISVRRRSSPMRDMSRGSVMARAAAVPISHGDGKMEKAAALAWLVGCPGSAKVRIETNHAGTCDELVRPGPRVDEAIGRVI